jgi:hypothetical protein
MLSDLLTCQGGTLTIVSSCIPPVLAGLAVTVVAGAGHVVAGNGRWFRPAI